jgi:cobalt-zinc-cadmium efflux system membrane fusion protein
MHTLLTLLALLALIAIPACRDRGAAQVGGAPSASASAAADAEMCREHAVLEAVCTQCNRALIPVFKAKGDYCEEHGFPESFCPKCHPEMSGRPAADVAASGDGPADGTKVRFHTKESARLAGLRFDQAVQQPTTREVIATARVVYDGARVAQINPRVSGVIRAIKADVGTEVRAGARLAEIESADVGAEQARLRAARARMELAEANYQRIEGLRQDGISPEKDLLAARSEREQARADVGAAQAALGMVGAGADGPGRYALTSPITGVVTQRNAAVGRLVDPEDIVFEVVDPSAMWVEFDVPEGDVALVNPGQTATVTFDSLPDREFAGTLGYVSPAVDTRTRTAVARMPMQNTDAALRANLFGRGRIAVSDPRASVLVPRAAVQRARSVHLVFVRVAEDAFEARRVKVGAASGDRVAVTGRLRPGETVVTEGSFLLKTETLKESIGAGCCDVE